MKAALLGKFVLAASVTLAGCEKDTEVPTTCDHAVTQIRGKVRAINSQLFTPKTSIFSTGIVECEDKQPLKSEIDALMAGPGLARCDKDTRKGVTELVEPIYNKMQGKYCF